jgi:hypothetical protein
MNVDPFRNLLKCMAAIAALSFCGATDAGSQIRKEADVHARLAKAPLIMFLAKGGKDACGPGCDTWIAVEGQFDQGAAERFAAFVERLDAKALPVFFNSPGGLTDEGIAMGRFLRQSGMRAGIAASKAACGSSLECKAAMAAGRAVPATWNSRDAICSSACVFALLGATERAVPEGVKVGVHSTAYFCFREDGRVLRPVGSSKDAVDCRNKLSVRERQLASYFADMGISNELVAAMNSVPSSRIRFLTRDEIARFKVETQDRASSASE